MARVQMSWPRGNEVYIDIRSNRRRNSSDNFGEMTYNAGRYRGILGVLLPLLFVLATYWIS
jgi:hypothetical protein